jgi:hypothetical protein
VAVSHDLSLEIRKPTVLAEVPTVPIWTVALWGAWVEVDVNESVVGVALRIALLVTTKVTGTLTCDAPDVIVSVVE